MSKGKIVALVEICLLIASCSISRDTEIDRVAKQYRPNDTRPSLPLLTPDTPEEDFLTYALLNNPRVEAAFYDWKATAEEVTVVGSPPLPKLTLGAEIQHGIMAFLPGLMTGVIYPDKLLLRAETFSAEAKKKRYIFEDEILRNIFKVKKTLYQATLLKEKIRLTKEILILVEGLETIAQKNLSINIKNTQTKDLVMIQSEKEHLKNEIANLEGERKPLMVRWREALGIKASEPDPPLPIREFPENTLPQDKDLLELALAHNLQLKQLEREVNQAETLVKLAYYENVPDLDDDTGLRVDTKKDPLLWMPELQIMLPIWREKITAQVSSALASEKRIRAMLSDAEINLAILLAEKSFMWGVSNRMINLLNDHHILNAKIKVESLNASLYAGMGGATDLLNAQRELLELEITYIEAMAERETIFAEVSTMVLSHWPEGIANIFKE